MVYKNVEHCSVRAENESMRQHSITAILDDDDKYSGVIVLFNNDEDLSRYYDGVGYLFRAVAGIDSKTPSHDIGRAVHRFNSIKR